MSAYLKDGGLAAGYTFYFDGGERSMKNLLRSYPEASGIISAAVFPERAPFKL